MTSRKTGRRQAQVSGAALPPVDSLPAWLRGDLRSDHAGETGAVFLYRGILAVSRDHKVRTFAREHLAQEQEHLAFFEAWLRPADTSLLIVLWRMAGWVLGALAASGGPNAVYLTVDAVEEFVVEHYNDQISRMAGEERFRSISLVLDQFCHDEQHHREDAMARNTAGQPGALARLWRSIVGTGSAAAVSVARII